MTTDNDPPASKRCTGPCGQEKPLTEFYADSKGRGLYGRRSKCKACTARQTGKYREVNREAVLETNRRYSAAYREANREAVLAGQRRWRQDNHKTELERRRQYREANRESVREQERHRYATNRIAMRKRKRLRYAVNREAEVKRARRKIAADRGAVLTHYSPDLPPCCACCGTTETLTIDHVSGGGNKHRREVVGSVRRSTAFYRWLINQRFPSGYQVLCMPCNRSKGTGERCRIHDDSPPRRSHHKKQEK